MTIIASHTQPFALFHQLSQRVVSPIGFGTNGEEKLMVVSKTYLGGDQRKWTFLPMESRELWKVVHALFFILNQVQVRTILSVFFGIIPPLLPMYDTLASLFMIIYLEHFGMRVDTVPSLRIVPEPADIIAELSTTISIFEAFEPVNADDPLKDHLRPK
ncbi:hypothetical protein V6N13_054974 [Hibiscus sabdariffa]